MPLRRPGEPGVGRLAAGCEAEMETSTRSVWWLGGAPCAGKSSIARKLGEWFALDLVHIDDSFDTCASKLDAARHPALSRWTALSWDQRWARPPDVLLGEVVACYREHLGFVLEDVAGRAAGGRHTLVEGSAVLPGDVAPMLGSRAEAVWLVPTREFQAQHYAQRPWVDGIVRQCADPSGAFERWMARDERFAGWLTQEVRGLGLTYIGVDGGRGVTEMAEVVARHFGLIGSEEVAGQARCVQPPPN
jgi:hypothetical protein